jgi:hypothetical protein
VLDQRVDEELGRSLQQWIELGEECAVTRVLEVIPEREREPGAAHLPHAPHGAVDGRGRPPDVGIVVRDPAARAVHLLCDPRAANRELLRHAQQRLDASGQGRRSGRPVVHLRIDVDRPLAAPGRVRPLVPDSLQVRGLRALA